MKYSFTEYYQEIYRPDVFKAQSKRPLHKSLTAVKQFVVWLGSDPKIHSITPKQVQDFLEHCVENVCSRHVATSKEYSIKAVLKHSKHPRFHDGRGPKGPTITLLPDKPEGGTKLKDVFANQYTLQKLRGKSPHTKMIYTRYINEFSVYLGYWATLDDLNDATVSGWLAWAETQPKRGGGKRAARSINNRRSYMLAFWNWCARKRLVELFPDVEKLTESVASPKAWRKEQLMSLMKAIDETPGKVRGVPAAAWWKALHLVLWDSGERITATLAIRWDWIDFADGTLAVPASARKGGVKAMLYSLKPETLKALEAIREPEREVVFPVSFKALDSLYQRYNKILIRAGLPIDRNSKFHRMRRTFASFIEAAGGNATDALEHSRRSTTKESYLDPSIVKQRPANELLFAIGAV